eukprot:TRINITY_DN1595_c3_g1_i1.p1 TRINITY_DN1595_c3_g1~~TRINITY_DN1595_c3_g1_i1.p1  ORF type:complete len:731 (+),score=179.74 TRINITY_DN1595_c3_g1_i1:62-2254(+)
MAAAADDAEPSTAEGATGSAAAQPTAESPELSEDKFAKLNGLLQRTTLYANFVEQELSVRTDDAHEESLSDKIKLEPPPKLLQGGDLKRYQRVGVAWLMSLYMNGVNGILADEMGLGKTVMTIAYFASLLEGKVGGPHLIVVPLSTLPNWEKEFKKWLPRCRLTVYYGKKEDRVELSSQLGMMGRRKFKRPSKGFFADPDKEFEPGWGVFLTTYQTVITDTAFFRKHAWQSLVVDEAHRLKKFDCALIQKLKVLETEHRVLLTGTPLQNNLSELWSILNFIMPSVFDDIKAFTAWFNLDSLAHTEQQQGAGDAEPASQQQLTTQQRSILTKLHAILRPFMLRRRKRSLSSEVCLPDKKEIALFCCLTAEQRKYYNALLDGKFRAMMKERDEGIGIVGPVRRQGSMSFANVLMQLQKMCNHPMLFDQLDPHCVHDVRDEVREEITETDADGLVYSMGTDVRYITRKIGDFDPESPADCAKRSEHILRSSAKMHVLDAILKRARAEGNKVLIFSRMTRMLDLITEYVEWRGFDASYRIDGTVEMSARQEMIDSFNAAEGSQVFLLGTRAGGQGINLAAANTVVLYDSDWNPQVDLQAQDRCHRIGQTSDVVVYRLITRGTVEQYLIERATRKIRLESVVIEHGRFESRKSHRLTEEELKTALAHCDQDAAFGTVDAELLDRVLDRKHVFKLVAESKKGGAADMSLHMAKRPRKMTEKVEDHDEAFLVLPDWE